MAMPTTNKSTVIAASVVTSTAFSVTVVVTVSRSVTAVGFSSTTVVIAVLSTILIIVVMVIKGFNSSIDVSIILISTMPAIGAVATSRDRIKMPFVILNRNTVKGVDPCIGRAYQDPFRFRCCSPKVYRRC